MPIFNGSLVDELLNELSSRLAAAPELIETYDLEDVRFQLSVLVADKLSSDRRRDLDLQGAAPPQDDEVEAADLEGAGCADALEHCGDHALEVLLECNASWHADGDGWSVREAAMTDANVARAAMLREIRAQAKTPVRPERTLAYLVQLLRDPAYVLLSLHQKLHQLEQLLLVQLHRLEGTGTVAAADGDDWTGFADATAAHHPGRIDGGNVALSSSTPPPAVAVSKLPSCSLLDPEGELSAEPGAIFLRRAVCCVRSGLPAASRNARALDVQAIAFFKDAQAALAYMQRCAGASKSEKARALLDQLAPVMRASATCWENERKYVGAARKQREVLRASQGRKAVRDDLDLLEACLETYAMSVLLWMDGDPDPPSLKTALEATRSRMASVLKSTLRAILPEYDRNATAERPASDQVATPNPTPNPNPDPNTPTYIQSGGWRGK